MRGKMKILYAGDSQVGGAANYLLGVLGWMKADLVHVPPSEKLPVSLVKKNFDAILLSDFSRKNLPADSEQVIAEKVGAGMGLMMIGGWGSFSGPFGGWKGSRIEKILPVSCLGKDDRTNFPGGAVVRLAQPHASVRGVSFQKAPVICGMNRVLPRKNSRTVLEVRRVLSNGRKVKLEKTGLPLLVTGTHTRTAAFTADFAPHWCGGLVDWGSKTLKLPVNSRIQIQVGDGYARLIASIVTWLASGR